MSATLRHVLAICGASGSAFARGLLRSIAASERVRELHLVVSEAGRRVVADELGMNAGSVSEMVDGWLADTERRAEVVIHPFRDIGASIASGSFRHDGMVVCPCSTATLAAIAHGTTQNLIHRAADVSLKERRKVLLMLRETPLSLVHLENAAAVTRAGAIVMPISPPFYHRPSTLEDLVADMNDRVLDHLGLPELVGRRWDGRGGAARPTGASEP